LQALEAQQYIESANIQQNKSYNLFSKRGKIYDRNGEELAVSLPQITIFANPYFVKDQLNYAIKLSEILNLDVEVLKEKLSKSNCGFVYIVRKISPELANQVMELNLEGIYSTREDKRFYPNGSLACNFIGFVGLDNIGLTGVELEYEKQLHGVDGEISAKYDGFGRPIPGTYSLKKDPIDGYDVYLTIDENIQYYAESRLKKAIEENGAKGGVIVIIEPQTGEVIAMANYPNFNLNEFDQVDKELSKNLSISFNYEPGSILKFVTAASAIDSGAVSKDAIFHLPPTIKVGGKIISEPFRHVAMDYSVADILINSANVGAVILTSQMSDEIYYNYLSNFGFGKPTGIDLPGEESGLLFHYDLWSSSTKATMSFGQGISTTPIQLIQAMATIVNNGIAPNIHIVKKIYGKNGDIDYSPKIKVAENRIISSECADAIKSMLIRVVEEGTGKNAKIEGYTVGGKTGTAQKPIIGGRGYYSDKNITSFIGFAPAENPALVCLVVIDEPSTSKGQVWGSTVAAPVFKDVVSFTLKYLRISSTTTDIED
jgi:stage V sporulation protein D (sporulation-specific penicillin-binding protein)